MIQRRQLLIASALPFAGGLAPAPLRAAEPVSVLLEPVPPFSYADAEGRTRGYAVELMEELLRRSGLDYQIEFNSWARIYQRALTQPRTSPATIAPSPEREALFHWFGPTAARRVYLYRLKSRPEITVPKLEAAKAYTTAVVREDAAERELLARGFVLGQHLDRSPDHAAMLRKLFMQRNELIAANSTVAAAMMERFGYDFQQIEPVYKLSEVSLYMGLRRLDGNQALAAQLQRHWEAMRRDGTVNTIASRYPQVQVD